MRGRHPAGNGAVGGEHASVVGSTFVQAWAARSSVVGSTFVQMWAARVLGGTFLGSTRFWAARVRHESAVASSFAVLADRERLQAGRCFPMCLSVAGSRFYGFMGCANGTSPRCAVDETLFSGRDNIYSEPGFLKLRSPRGQLLAYLCTYLLLSLKR